MPTRAFLLVGAGGAAGASLRHLVQESWPSRGGEFPTATLVLNLAGAFLLGLLLGRLAVAPPRAGWMRPLLGIGVLGATTTFSGFALDTLRLADGGRPAVAVGYVLLSLAGGLVLAALGLRVQGWPLAEPAPDEGES